MNKLNESLVALGVTSLLAATAVYAAPDAGKGAVSWTQQMARAPHRTFTGKEYCKEKWDIIMPQMATYGQLSFHEARNIAAFLGSASKPCGDSWFDKNVLLAGYGVLTTQRDNDTHESETEAEYAQHLFIKFSDRTLFQSEFEFAKHLDPSEDAEFEGAEYFNLTYFAGDHVDVSVGKILNDFNFSTLRLHPAWMNLAGNLPWTAQFLPHTTMGGKIGAHWETNGAILGGTVYGGSDSETKYLEADEMVGGRFGAYLPASNLEFGVSAAKADANDDKTVYGAYAIKKFTRGKLEGEVAADSDRSSFWVGGTYQPWQSEVLSRVSLVTRFQNYHTNEPMHHDEDEHVDAAINVASADEEEEHHGALPEGNAKEWYLGLVYDHPAIRSVHFRLQAGYVAGSGEAHDGWRAQAAFHW